MQILRAPNDNTVNRVTSVGEVKFVEGIATEFTPEQAEFFTQRQRDYTLEDIETEEEAADARAAVVKAAEAEEAAEQKIIDAQAAKEKALEEEQAAKAKIVAERAAAAKAATEAKAAAKVKAAAISEFLQNVEGASFGDVRAFAKANGIKAGGNRQAIIDRIKAAGPPDGEDVKPATDGGEGPADMPSTPEGTESPGEGETTNEDEPTAHIEELIDLNEADHETLVELAKQYGVVEDEAWSTEELRSALLADEGIQEEMGEVMVDDAEEEETPPDGEDEQPPESGEASEATQDASDGAQSAPAATSADQGAGGLEMPTAQDSHEFVVQWCRANGVNDNGTKVELLERIYADGRFKK